MSVCLERLTELLRTILDDDSIELMRPKRFLITTYLYVMGPATMSRLQKALGISWGELSTHIEWLYRNGFIETRRVLTLRGPRTLVRLTERGVERYERLVSTLKKVVDRLTSCREETETRPDRP